VAPQTSYFTDASMVRKVHREYAVRLAGPRTLLLQATHPVAFAGFLAHTGALDASYERLARTARVIDAIIYGECDEARELALEIVLHPPAPLHARPLLELVNQITVGLLPGEIRRGYGLSWDPARSVALHGGAEYVRRVMLPLLPRRLRLRAA
jgi:uncharacterized protein (DUF2236 family)